MNELEYLIYQALIQMDTNRPLREIHKDVKAYLEKERISFDKELVDVLIEFCLSKLE